MGTRRRKVVPKSNDGKTNSNDSSKGSSVQKLPVLKVVAIVIFLLIAVASFLVVFNLIDISKIYDGQPAESSHPVQDSPPEPEKQKANEEQKLSTEDKFSSIKTEFHNAEKKSKEAKPQKKKYKHADITNAADNKIRSDIDDADSLREAGKFGEAMVKYAVILARYPNSPRAQYGKARCTDAMAEKERSNKKLESGIEEYLKVLDLPDVPKALMVEAGTRCADRQTFRGWGGKAISTMKKLTSAYPGDTDLLNKLGVKCLMANKNEEARNAFKQVLKADERNGFALVHMGFIVKTVDHNYAASIPYLSQGIRSGDDGVIDGRFFFHLGDALHRTGKPSEALDTYQLGADHGLFKSKWQRSLYNVDRLTSRPWWTHKQTGSAKLFKALEDNWEAIRDEGLANLDPKTGSFVAEDEDLREKGDWQQFSLYSRGRKNDLNCRKAPRTCAVLDRFPESTSCKRGQVKFSVMQPGVHVWPHCGPTNCRLRAHLGLVVPDDRIRIRVVEETRTWTEGKVFIFDDSFEHEVWHESDSLRMVLIVDIWHPELSQSERASLSAI